MDEKFISDRGRIPDIPIEFLSKPRVGVVIKIRSMKKNEKFHGIVGASLELFLVYEKTTDLKSMKSMEIQPVTKENDYYFSIHDLPTGFNGTLAIAVRIPGSTVSENIWDSSISEYVQFVDFSRYIFSDPRKYVDVEDTRDIFKELVKKEELIFRMVLTLDSQCSIEYSKDPIGNATYTGFGIQVVGGIRKKKKPPIPHDFIGYMSYSNYSYTGSFVAGERMSCKERQEKLTGIDDREIDTIFVRFRNNEPDSSDDEGKIQFVQSERQKDFYEGQLKATTKLGPKVNLRELKPNGIGFLFSYSKRMLFCGEFRKGKKHEFGMCYNVETGESTFCQYRDDKLVKEFDSDRHVLRYWIEASQHMIEKFVRANKKQEKVYDYLLEQKDGEVYKILKFFCKYVSVVYKRFNLHQYSEITNKNQRRNLFDLKTDINEFVECLQEKLRSFVGRGREITIRQKLIDFVLQRLHGVIYSYYLQEFKDEERELRHKIQSFRTFVTSSKSSRELKVDIIKEVLMRSRNKDDDDEGKSLSKKNENAGDDALILEAMRILTASYRDIGTNVGKKTNELFKLFVKLVEENFLEGRIRFLKSHDQFKEIVRGGEKMLDLLLGHRIHEVQSEKFVRNFEKTELLYNDFLLIAAHSKVDLVVDILLLLPRFHILKRPCHQCPSSKARNVLKQLQNGFTFLRYFMNHPSVEEKQKFEPHNFGIRDLLSRSEVKVYDFFSKNMMLLFTKIHDDFGRDNCGLVRHIREMMVNVLNSVKSMALSLSLGGTIENREAGKVELGRILEEGSSFMKKEYRQNSKQLLDFVKIFEGKLFGIKERYFSSKPNVVVEKEEEDQEEEEGGESKKKKKKDPMIYLVKSIELKMGLFKWMCNDIKAIFKYREGVSPLVVKCLEQDISSFRYFIKFQKRRNELSSTTTKENNLRKNEQLCLFRSHFFSYMSSCVHIIYNHVKSSSEYFEKKNVIRMRLHDRFKCIDEDTKDSRKLFIRMRERVRDFSKIMEEIWKYHSEEEEEKEQTQKTEESKVSFCAILTRILKQGANSLVGKILSQIAVIERTSPVKEGPIKKKLELLKNFCQPETNCFVFCRIEPFLSFLGSLQRTLVALTEFYRIQKKISEVSKSRVRPLLFFKREVEETMKKKMIRKLKALMFSTLKWSVLSLQKLEFRKVFHDFFFHENVISLQSLEIDPMFMPKPNALLNFSDIENSIQPHKERNNRKSVNVEFYIKSYIPYQNAIDRISVLSEVQTFEEKVHILENANREMKTEMQKISGKPFLEETHILSMTIFVLLFSNNIHHLTEFNFLADFSGHDKRSCAKIIPRYKEFLDLTSRFVPNESDALKVQLDVNTKTVRLWSKLWDMGYKDSTLKKKPPITSQGGQYLKKNLESSLHWLDCLLDYIYCKINTLEEEEDVLEIEMKNNQDGNVKRLIGGRDSFCAASLMVDVNKMYHLDWMEYVQTYVDHCNEILDAIDIIVFHESKDRGILKVKFNTKFSSRVYRVIRSELWERFGEYVSVKELTMRNIVNGVNVDDDEGSNRLKEYDLFAYQSRKNWRVQVNDEKEEVEGEDE